MNNIYPLNEQIYLIYIYLSDVLLHKSINEQIYGTLFTFIFQIYLCIIYIILINKYTLFTFILQMYLCIIYIILIKKYTLFTFISPMYLCINMVFCSS